MLHNDGGAPMNLSGPIVLCGRSSNDTVRGYNGRLTHLALFDQAITPLEAYAIYMQVPGFLQFAYSWPLFRLPKQGIEPAEASRWPCDSRRIEACSVCT